MKCPGHAIFPPSLLPGFVNPPRRSFDFPVAKTRTKGSTSFGVICRDAIYRVHLGSRFSCMDAINRVPTNHLHIHPEGRRPINTLACTILGKCDILVLTFLLS